MTKYRRRAGSHLGGAAILALALAPPATHAETLADAIAMAYQSNPTLQSERAQLAGVDEGYVQARAALGPTATLQATATYEQTRYGYYPPNESNTGQAQVTITQSLYNGGANALAVAASRAQIAAARQALRVGEGNVVLAVVQAYADVVRDAASLGVHEANIRILMDEVTEARARERDGEITTTDVAQAEAQLAAEHALLATARGQLQISRAEYVTAVGQNPGELAPRADAAGPARLHR